MDNTMQPSGRREKGGEGVGNLLQPVCLDLQVLQLEDGGINVALQEMAIKQI